MMNIIHFNKDFQWNIIQCHTTPHAIDEAPWLSSLHFTGLNPTVESDSFNEYLKISNHDIDCDLPFLETSAIQFIFLILLFNMLTSHCTNYTKFTITWMLLLNHNYNTNSQFLQIHLLHSKFNKQFLRLQDCLNISFILFGRREESVSWQLFMNMHWQFYMLAFWQDNRR